MQSSASPAAEIVMLVFAAGAQKILLSIRDCNPIFITSAAPPLSADMQLLRQALEEEPPWALRRVERAGRFIQSRKAKFYLKNAKGRTKQHPHICYHNWVNL